MINPFHNHISVQLCKSFISSRLWASACYFWSTDMNTCRKRTAATKYTDFDFYQFSWLFWVENTNNSELCNLWKFVSYKVISIPLSFLPFVPLIFSTTSWQQSQILPKCPFYHSPDPALLPVCRSSPSPLVPVTTPNSPAPQYPKLSTCFLLRTPLPDCSTSSSLPSPCSLGVDRLHEVYIH